MIFIGDLLTDKVIARPSELRAFFLGIVVSYD